MKPTKKTHNTILLTRESCAAAGSRCCYSADEVAALVPPSGLTPRQVAELDIPIDDRTWALTRLLAVPDSLRASVDSAYRMSAVTSARRALALTSDPDPRSTAAVDIAERYALGDATADELRAADADAARAAARAAAWAAAWAADADAWAADAADRQLTLDDLVTRLEAANSLDQPPAMP